MKSTLYLLFITSFLLLMGCSKDEIIEEPAPVDHSIEAWAFYAQLFNLNELIPDVGAKVFIYYGIDNGALLDHNYGGDGIFIHNREGTTIIPDQEATIDEMGMTSIKPLYTDKKFAIVMESRYYKNRLASGSYSEISFSYGEKIKWTVNNYP